MTACPACTLGEGVAMRPSDVADFCNDHAARWREIQQILQPPVRRPWAPRCLICHHHPRLLQRLPHKDAWECRWGHEVSGYDLHLAERGAA